MPSARPTKQEVLTAYRRAELLESARRVFGQSGFEKATMDAIARQADVAKGTVYLYYRSKRDIYDAAFTGCLTELEAVTRARVAAASSLQDAIRIFIATRVEYFQQRPDFFRMYLAEFGRSVASRRRSNWRQLVQRQTAILHHAIARAVARREIRPVNAVATALAIFDLTRGLVARHLIEDVRRDPRRDAAFLTELIWTGLRPARERQPR
jgi:AcrR family transcriptional regulator